MSIKIQLRRGTTAEWTSANPTLAEGEIGLDTTLDKFKIGDGVTAWDSLSFSGLTQSDLASYATTTSLSNHESDTTNVHGIADTSLLATTSYVDTAESDAITSSNSYADSLATNYDPSGSASTAESNSNSYTDSAISTHNSDTTSVHGISNTANLVYTDDSRLSDSRTPTSHASTHESGGSDEITIAQSQVTNLTSDLSSKIASTEKGAANGIATLDGNTKIPSTQLPSIAITSTHVVNSESTMLALTVEEGDVAVRTDLNKSFILAGSDPTLLVSWQELLTPTDVVQSVDGRTGTVSLSDLYDTAGSASAVASDLTDHENDTTSVHGISNTANLVYTDDSRLSDSRTPTAHASTHGSGGSDEITISQSQVTDLSTDLSAKSPLESPTFTGTPLAPTASAGTNNTQISTTAYVDSALGNIQVEPTIHPMFILGGV